MEFEVMVQKETNVSVDEFWKVLGIWLDSPHVVDRRLLASVKLFTVEIKQDGIDILKNIGNLTNLSELLESPIEGSIKIFLNQIHCTQYCNISSTLNPLATCSRATYLCVKKLLPRNPQVFSTTLQFVIVNKDDQSIIFSHKQLVYGKRPLGPSKCYKIKYSANGTVSMKIEKIKVVDDLSIFWLRDKLFPRLIKWTKNEHSQGGLTSSSLSFISSEKYVKLYNKLKNKYGMEMVKIWPENTDPAKFVYEDVAIATYLLLLWEKEREEKNITQLQSFLDLGCGNGLLVHILSGEGHPGIGIDLRRRKIWDLYPKTTSLEVRTIFPSAANLFPEADWLIGNHSDELTPWIPVIAARSSYKCRFFLLPCCSYEFDGSKYQRNTSSRSQYSDYIYYIKDICEHCGFETVIDRLRIPSTKRTCLIGWKRNYAEKDTDTQDQIIQGIITAKATIKILGNPVNIEGNDKQWSPNFKPRESTEKVRNCTQLSKELIKDIVDIVVAQLLNKTRRICLPDRQDRTWNAGGQIEIGEIAKMIPSEILKQLRNECGGIQTLLRNNGHIFSIVQGKVQFRLPGTESKSKKRKNDSKTTIKTKPCWFFNNHPDGCPSADDKCNFIH